MSYAMPMPGTMPMPGPVPGPMSGAAPGSAMNNLRIMTSRAHAQVYEKAKNMRWWIILVAVVEAVVAIAAGSFGIFMHNKARCWNKADCPGATRKDPPSVHTAFSFMIVLLLAGLGGFAVAAYFGYAKLH